MAWVIVINASPLKRRMKARKDPFLDYNNAQIWLNETQETWKCLIRHVWEIRVER